MTKWLPTFRSFINLQMKEIKLQFYFYWFKLLKGYVSNLTDVYVLVLVIHVHDLTETSAQILVWMNECLVVGLTIGPLPQPRAVQACSLSMCRLQGSSPSTTKNLCVELEFKIWTPSSHRPKLVMIPVRRIHWDMKYEIKKENKNDISNLFSGHSADRSFRGSE